MLLIYKPNLITNCREMIKYWRQLACDNGLPGLYIGYQHHSSFDYNIDELGFDFGVEFEPMYTVREINIEKKQSFGMIKRVITHPKWLYRKLKEKIIKSTLCILL